METIWSVDEFETLAEDASKQGRVVLLQLGSPVCERCPQFTHTIDELKQTYEFEWLYTNAHDEKCEFVEHFGVRQLPAFVIVVLGEVKVVTNATPTNVTNAVKGACLPTFVTDLDF